MRPEGDYKDETRKSNAPHRCDNELRIIVPAKNAAVRRALKNIRNGLRPMGFSTDELASVEIVLAEVLNNIVEHAYGEITDGLIDIRLTQSATDLICTVLDTGKKMPNDTPPLGQRPLLSDDIENLPEGGFGWFMIRELAHELAYRRDGSRNILTFRMSVGQHPG